MPEGEGARQRQASGVTRKEPPHSKNPRPGALHPPPLPSPSQGPWAHTSPSLPDTLTPAVRARPGGTWLSRSWFLNPRARESVHVRCFNC